MLQKKFILLGFTFFLSCAVRAQSDCNAVFSGRVLDENDRPVIGAAIQLLPGKKGQVSDANGEFRFGNICPGQYNVRVRFLGHQDEDFILDISGDQYRVVHLHELPTELGEVIIQHHDASHTEHATNFIQLDERKLAERAGKSLGESLRSVTGVGSIQTGPGIFKPVIHGVHSQRVLVLNHGIRQEGQQWGAEHAPEIDPFIASNIVVIKDASAIRYGTDAIGGVIVVNPPALPERSKLGGTFNTVLQSNGRSGAVSGMLEGGVPKLPGWGWRVQGTGRKAGDFSARDYGLTNTGVEELNYSAALGYHKEKAGIDAFFSHFQTQLGILRGTSISSQDDLVEAMERAVPNYTRDFSYAIDEPRQAVSHNLVKINGHFNTAGGEWRWQYGFQNNNRQEYDIRKGSRREIPSIDLRLNTHSLDVEWETHHSGNRTFSLGASGMLQQNRNVFGTQRIPFIPDFDNVSIGAYAIGKLFLSKWTLDLGARYDLRDYSVRGFDFKNAYYADSFTFHNVSATVGATRSVGSTSVVGLNFSSSWRPPHVAELYSVGTHQSAAAIEYGLLLNDETNEVLPFQDVDFQAEQAFKSVMTYRLNTETFSAEVSPFANLIRHYIYLKPSGITQNLRGVYPYFRYDQTDALFVGVDLSMRWHVTRHLQVQPQVSLLRARDVVNNDFFISIPSQRADLTLRYERPSRSEKTGFYAEASAVGVMKQRFAPRVVSARQIKEAREEGTDLFADNTSSFDFMEAPKGYWLLNLATGLSVKAGKIQYDFRLSSENTMNKSYREYTNRFRYYADDLGRNLGLSFKCIF